MKTKINITYNFPILIWYGATWLCENVKRAQMKIELETNVIYKN